MSVYPSLTPAPPDSSMQTAGVATQSLGCPLFTIGLHWDLNLAPATALQVLCVTRWRILDSGELRHIARRLL